MRLHFLIVGLSLLILANLAVVYGFVASPRPSSEGFTSYFLNEAGGAKTSYEPIGPFDEVDNRPKNGVSQWKYRAANETLRDGAKEFVPGPDNLFILKDAKTSPECCGASFSSGSNCACTTPSIRQYIASRGGNKSVPEDV